MNSEIPNLKTPGLRTLSHIQPLEFHDVVTNIRHCMALTSLQHGKGAMKPRLVSSCFCSSSFFSSTLLGIRDGHDKSPPFCSMMFPLKLTSHLYVLPIYIYIIYSISSLPCLCLPTEAGANESGVPIFGLWSNLQWS